MGGWIGGQARFVMVPYAVFNLLKFPDRDKALAKIRDLTMLTDSRLSRRFSTWSLVTCFALDLLGCVLLVQGVYFGTKQVYEQLERH